MLSALLGAVPALADKRDGIRGLSTPSPQEDADDALTAALNSLRRTERLVITDPGNLERQHDLASAFDRLGDLLAQRGMLDQAMHYFRNSLSVRLRFFGAETSNSAWQRELAANHGKLSLGYERQGRREDALREATQAQEIMAALVANAPDNTEWKSELIRYEEQISRMRTAP
jgi:tetratricopeptide (TPR) repeat protein